MRGDRVALGALLACGAALALQAVARADEAPRGAVAVAQAQAPTPTTSAPSAPPDDSQPSAAEELLFLHPHMAHTTGPRTLTYAYVAESASAPRATDRATLVLQPRADGQCCSVHGEYLSGEMAVNLPDLDDAAANPILLYFLEGEVRLMQRTTHGQSAHFRRQLRQSFVDVKTVADTTVRWGAADVPAHVVRLSPFLDDPYRARFENLAATQYEFVLSDAVPGGVLKMSATLPGAKPGDPPLAQRSLTLVDPQPAPPAKN